MDKQSYLVSIITPCYNSQDYISETINSVLNQTYTNWELIIVDDYSQDNSTSIIKKFQKENSKITLIENSNNLGAAYTRNKATEVANGDYIAFLDSDDLWKPNKLEFQLEFMLKNNTDVSFSSYELIDEAGKPLNKMVKSLPELTLEKLLKSNYIGNLTGIYNASKIGKITVKNLRKRQDWLLWIEALKRTNNKVLGIEESLAYYRVRKNSMSSNKVNLLKYNFLVFRRGLGFSFFKSLWYMFNFLIEHFFKKSKQEITLPEN